MPQTSGSSMTIGRVEPAAEADFEDAGVRPVSRESEEGGRGIDLEQAGADVRRWHRARLISSASAILDQLAGDADPLVVADQVRAGEGMHLLARRLERGAQEGAGRSLAVGAGDMEDGRQPVLRAAQLVEQRGDAIEAELIADIGWLADRSVPRRADPPSGSLPSSGRLPSPPFGGAR